MSCRVFPSKHHYNCQKCFGESFFLPNIVKHLFARVLSFQTPLKLSNMFGDNFVILIWSKMLNVIFVESFAFQTPLKLYKNMFGESLVLPNTTTMAKYFLAKGLSFQRQIKMTNIIGRELSLQPPLQWSNLVR